jgi:hypothetical protein
MKPKQNPYPWYAVNEVTRELEPYAVYAARREIFNRTFQPEADPQFLKFGANGRVNEINTDLLAESIRHDNMRYGVLSGDSLMIEYAYNLMHAPERIEAQAKINTSYMDGFIKWKTVRQTRVHMMTACLLMGHWDDYIVTKKWIRWKTICLWACAIIRATPRKNGTRRYFPAKRLMNYVANRLPPLRTTSARLKWPWERVVRSLGLDGMWGARESGRSDDREIIPTIFSWDVPDALTPEQIRKLETIVPFYYAGIDGE